MQIFVSGPYVHSWAEDDSTPPCFDIATLAPPPGKNRDHRKGGPVRLGLPPLWRHASEAQRSQA